MSLKRRLERLEAQAALGEQWNVVHDDRIRIGRGHQFGRALPDERVDDRVEIVTRCRVLAPL